MILFPQIGDLVLKNATGTFDGTWAVIKTTGGTISDGGPVKDKKYAIGADNFPTKYDRNCTSSDPTHLAFGFAQ